MEQIQKFCIVLLFLLGAPVFLTAQHKPVTFQKREMAPVQKAATVTVSEIKEDWSPFLEHMEMPAPGFESYKEYLVYLKRQLPQRQQRQFKNRQKQRADSVKPPKQLQEFEGNAFGSGIPNDNDLAISNDGYLVSVINSSIYIFDVNQDTLLQDISLAAFADTLAIPQNKFDPKVKYDPQEDRFILSFLNGNTDSTSYIITAFSSSSDPTGSWNIYALSGNPFGANRWSDYPMIAINEDELFITINLVETGEPWQEGFYQSLLWQIDKKDGYNGDSLTNTIYNNIRFNGRPIWNMRPVQGGDGLSEKDGLYLLSNRNFAITNDTVFLLELTGALNDPSATVNVSMLKTNPSYGLAPDGKQRSGGDLQTNDSRILGAFVQNNMIQYVQVTRNPVNGRAAVFHGVISDLQSQPKFQAGHIIGSDTLDFGYPNIAYTGRFPSDREAIINFLHTDSMTDAGSSVVFYDGRGNYSKRTTVKQGSSFINALGGNSNERWGDYTGIQPKYDEPGKAWMAGSFGQQIDQGLFDPRVSGTWIAELASPDTSTSPPVGIASHQRTAVNEIVAYPNPASNRVTVAFEAEQTQFVTVQLLNSRGKHIKTLLENKLEKGKNRFGFSTQPLPSGVYILAIQSRTGRVFSKKITISH